MRILAKIKVLINNNEHSLNMSFLLRRIIEPVRYFISYFHVNVLLML